LFKIEKKLKKNYQKFTGGLIIGIDVNPPCFDYIGKISKIKPVLPSGISSDY